MRLKFTTKFILLSFIFLFIKIYQHNQIIKLSFAKQRLEKRKSVLKKEKNELLVTLFKLKSSKRIKKIAQEKLGLRPIRFSQVVTCTFSKSNLNNSNNLNTEGV